MIGTTNRDELLKQLGQVLNKLSLKCIYTDIIKEIPNLTWADIKQFAVRKKIGLNTKEVTRIICNYVSKSKECSKYKLIELISRADLIYTAKYSFRKTWYTFKLVKRNSNPIQHIHQIKQTLNDIFHHQRIDNQIQFYQYDGIFWIQIYIFNSSKRGTKTISKNYFAIVSQEDYIFSLNKNVSRLVLDALKIALRSRQITEKPLNGRIIKSLIQMLKNKDNKTHNFDLVEGDIIIPDNKSTYTKTSIGYNFLKDTIRKEYADRVIGENPQVLQTLVIKPKNNTINIRQLLNDDKLPENFNIQLKISSPDIMKCVKNLMVNEIIPTPAPNWCTELPHFGANIINLKLANEQRS